MAQNINIPKEPPQPIENYHQVGVINHGGGDGMNLEYHCDVVIKEGKFPVDRGNYIEIWAAKPGSKKTASAT